MKIKAGIRAGGVTQKGREDSARDPQSGLPTG
jgi:hypothetical protein